MKLKNMALDTKGSYTVYSWIVHQVDKQCLAAPNFAHSTISLLTVWLPTSPFQLSKINNKRQPR